MRTASPCCSRSGPIPPDPLPLPDGLPQLPIEGLSPDDSRELLRSTAKGPLNENVEDHIVRSVGGSPLALVELATVLSEEQLIGGELLPDPLPLSTRLEDHFLEQLRRLSDDAQSLVLVAATDPSEDPLVLRHAAEVLGIPDSAVDEIEDLGLLTIDPVVRFRHPLVRSAVYRAAGPSDRRRAHAALADAMTERNDLDRRAWHRAAATVGPDAEVADELDLAADRVRSRGRHAAEGSFRARAAELTPDRRTRSERYLAAAQANLTAGAPNVAGQLLERSQPDPDDAILRAQFQRVSAGLQAYTDAGPVPALLISAAQALEDHDVPAAREMYAAAVQAAMVSAQLTSEMTLVEVARAALDAPRLPGSTPSAADLLMEGFATRLAVGYPEAVPILRSALAALTDDLSGTELDRWTALGNNLFFELWDIIDTKRMLDRFEAVERERGALESLRVTLGGQAHVAMWSGRFARSEALHSEATAISVALGDSEPDWEALKVATWAWQGDEDNARFVAELLTGELGQSYGAGCIVNLGRTALVVLELGLGNYRAAFDLAQLVVAEDIPPQSNQALPDLVEAGVRCGELTAARNAMAILEERAAACPTPWALGLLDRSRALLDDGDGAEALYRSSIAHLDEAGVRPESARTHLVLGEWLRRRNRRVDAREELRTACEMFEEMGARAFLERATTELAATGARARRRSPETSSDLTPQETRIAEQAAAGATNRDIAASLFISSSTVDYHLRKVFRKLGVSSRRELVDVLGR